MNNADVSLNADSRYFYKKNVRTTILGLDNRLYRLVLAFIYPFYRLVL
jgi:hypothetical protein